MEKYLRPKELDLDPDSPNSGDEWKRWKSNFSAFVEAINPELQPNKLQLLKAHVTCPTYNLIEASTSYDAAIEILDKRFLKPTNIVYARHKLATRRQKPGESLSSYIQNLRSLANECSFEAVSAEVNKSDCVRDAFISGISSTPIRQRLLENLNLTLDAAIELANSLDMAHIHSQAYGTSDNYVASLQEEEISEQVETNAAITPRNCGYCGRGSHPRSMCKAKNARCHNCGVVGHFSSVCHRTHANRTQPSRFQSRVSNQEETRNRGVSAALPTVASTCAASGIDKSMIKIFVGLNPTTALVDTGSSISLISETTVQEMKIQTENCSAKVSLASFAHNLDLNKMCMADLVLDDKNFKNVKFYVVKNLCAPVLLGLDFLEKFSSIVFPLGGSLPSMSVSALVQAKVDLPSLFSHLTPDCQPVAARYRNYSKEDLEFIRCEVRRLLAERIIVPSNSPWRSQVVVVKQTNKKRLAVDYSETINKYTLPNAYPIPRITDIIQDLSKYSFFSKIDLTSAYHQIPIPASDRHYTAFEADGALYEFTRIPFGVTNGVACFQEILNNIIRDEKLMATYAYLDDVTICGRTQMEHDENLKRFLEVAGRLKLTINEQKSVYSKQKVAILGHLIENHEIKPDPSRLRPLLELSPPNNAKTMRRVTGLFAHYSKWIPRFSHKLQKFMQGTFPLDDAALSTFEDLKKEISAASLMTISDEIPFTVETDASD